MTLVLRRHRWVQAACLWLVAALGILGAQGLASGAPGSPAASIGQKARAPTGSPMPVEPIRYCAVAFSGEGNMLAGTHNATIRLWDVKTSRRIAVLRGHANVVNSIAISRDGRRLVSGSSDGAVRVWALPAGALMHTLQAHRLVLTVAIARDNRTAATGGHDFEGRIRLWDLRRGILLRTLEMLQRSETRALAFSPDGLTVASVSGQTPDEGISLSDVRTGRLKRRIATDTLYDLLAYSPDGRHLAAAGSGRTGSWLELVDARTGQILRDGPGGRPSAMTFSPDGTILVIAHGGDIWLWNHLTDEVRRIRSVKRQCVSVDFSRDGRYLAHGSDEIRLWDPRTRILRGILR